MEKFDLADKKLQRLKRALVLLAPASAAIELASYRKAYGDQVLHNCRVIEPVNGIISDPSLGLQTISVPIDGSDVLFKTNIGALNATQLGSVYRDRDIVDYIGIRVWRDGQPVEDTRFSEGAFNDPYRSYQEVQLGNITLVGTNVAGGIIEVKHSEADYSEVLGGDYLTQVEGQDLALAVHDSDLSMGAGLIVLQKWYLDPAAPEGVNVSYIELVANDSIPTSRNTVVKGIKFVGNQIFVTIGDKVASNNPAPASILNFEVDLVNNQATYLGYESIDGITVETGPISFNTLNNLVNPSSDENISAIFINGQYTVCHDIDADGVADGIDNCLNVPNADQADTDSDGVGDACEPVIPPTDTDGDGVADADDNCPNVPNADQADIDFNGVGDACDEQISADSDGDGIPDEDDNCPYDYDRTQANADFDSYGDVCDPCPEDASNQCTTTSTCDGFVSEPCVLASIEYCYEIGTNPVPGKTDCSILNNVQVTSCIANFDACRCDAVAPIFFHEKSGESCSLSTPIQCSDGSLITRGKIEETMNNNNCEAFVDEDTCEIQCTLDSECVGSTCPTDVDAGTDAEDDTGIVAPDAGDESDTGVAPDAVGNDVFTAPPKAEQPKEGCTVVGVSHNETPASISEATSFAVFVAFLMAVYQQSRHHTKQ